MKKLITIILISIIALTITSCGEKDEVKPLNLTEPTSSSSNTEATDKYNDPSEFENQANETLSQSNELSTEPNTESPTITSKKEEEDVIEFKDPTTNKPNSSSNSSKNNAEDKNQKSNSTDNNKTTPKQNSTEAPKSNQSNSKNTPANSSKQKPTEAAKPKPTEASKEKPAETKPKATEKPNTSKQTESKLDITFDSNIFDSVKKTYTTNKNGTVTVCYYIDFDKMNEIKIDSIQFDIKYDTKYLSVDPKKNCSNPDDSNYDLSPMFPIAKNGGTVNMLKNGTIKFVDTNVNGRELKNSKGLIPVAKVVFDIKKGTSGSSKVTLNCTVLDFINSKSAKRYTMQDPVNGRMKEIYKYIKSISKFYIKIK